MACKLCLAERPLRRSHIVPEFLYKPLYDHNHRAMKLAAGEDKPAVLQKGLREKLLCDKCEQLLNDNYEKPFHREWRVGRLIPQRLDPRSFYLVRGLDYRAIKLFLLSVLFRASVSTLDAFSLVTLGETHEERLRQMVLNGDPGGLSDYPVVGLFAVDDNGTPLPCVASPVRYRLFGAWCYPFIFGGCEWTFFVSGHTVHQVDKLGIWPSGDFILGAEFLRDLRTFKAARALDAERAGATESRARGAGRVGGCQ